MKSKAVILLSGGLDSTVALALSRSRWEPVLALCFDYGQKAAPAERRCARALARRYGVEFLAVPLPWMRGLGSSALQRGGKIPRFDPARFADLAYQRGTAKAVWVPNRNGLFVNIAACFAESLGCRGVVTGFNAEEGATFKDNTPGFVSAVNRSLAWSAGSPVRVVSPAAAMDKTTLVREALRLGVPLELTHSCYTASRPMCGRCESCRRSIRAYRTAGAWPFARGLFSNSKF